jgi:hypothetical protein
MKNRVILMWAALTLLAPPYATAGVITLDFDSVAPNAGNGPAYLSSYGITLTNLTPSGLAGMVDIFNDSGPSSLWPNHNFLSQNGAGAPPTSYTMNFATPLQSIGFERFATPSNLTTEPQWSATAYVGASPVGTVGESLDSWGNSPARPFTLSGSGITSLTISANGFGFTALGSVPLDDFVLTSQDSPVPEPATITMLSIGVAALAGYRLQRGTRARAHLAPGQ